EVEVDAVCDGEVVLIPGIMEHIERAGVHSGDSIAVYPAQDLGADEAATIVEHTMAIGRALGVKGLMNIQFVVMPPSAAPSRVYVLEVNPRASRTVPFISKVTGVPLVRLAVEVMLGRSLSGLGYQSGLWPTQHLVAVKAPVFSMSKLAGVDSFLGPEMKSTGEVMGVDYTYSAALAKALLAAGLTLPPQGAVLVSIADRDKVESRPIIHQLAELGYRLFATEGTAAMIESSGLAVTQISKKLSQDYPTVVDIIREGRVDGVINTLTHDQVPLRDGFQIRRAATERRIPCFTSLDTARATVAALANSRFPFSVLPLREYLGGKVKGTA
ncbi:MAG: carbamoyl phosphate synthase large subunit, partial [Dehalococcoidia bacterium]